MSIKLSPKSPHLGAETQLNKYMYILMVFFKNT